ncbi:MAG: DUF3822 family protein [Cruoricaptor ignavus]|nr:DUF3822 family protein [Cruoricaptor ignavus]
MKKLNLLFTKDRLQGQILNNKTVQQEYDFSLSEEVSEDFLSEKLDFLLQQNVAEITVLSALNHFTLMPAGFTKHDLGYDLVAYNSPVNRETEELMLSVNQKFGVQFYYTFPLDWYKMIKDKKILTKFNFSGEKFLNSLTAKQDKEIHINLYHNQCEFFALDRKKVVLYNNLDVNSEVDFLYFVMFTLSKIGFGTQETHFYVYGETTENDTFISELGKFVNHLKIVFDNLPKKNFILN